MFRRLFFVGAVGFEWQVAGSTSVSRLCKSGEKNSFFTSLSNYRIRLAKSGYVCASGFEWQVVRRKNILKLVEIVALARE
jgi:hypothetical protein